MEVEVFWCKVTHCITCPDIIVCMEKVGADTSQKGDGAVGGEKLVHATGTTPKEKASTR